MSNRPAALPLGKALSALGLPAATWHRRVSGKPKTKTGRPSTAPKPQSNALSPLEQQEALDLLRCDRFVDRAPAQIVHKLLDEGRYVCSESAFYRLLAKHGELKERRRVRRHTSAAKPELLATGPNQVWSWDITRLKGPEKWSYFYLYVILDIFSRYILAWTVGERESSSIFQSLMLQATLQQEIAPDQLTLHSDRGGPMKSKSTAQLLTDLGVMRSLSRPHTSNDNPFIESCFRTTKYHPDFPERFETLEKAQAYMAEFMHWYNHDHHHSGIAFLTPFQLHSGQADDIISQRQTILDKAFSVNPSRFKKPPVHPPAPTQAWINPPKLILPPTTLEVPR